jgi:hypothetical protein
LHRSAQIRNGSPSPKPSPQGEGFNDGDLWLDFCIKKMFENGAIWLDLVGFGWIWLDLPGFSWIQLDFSAPEAFLKSTATGCDAVRRT